MTSYGSRRVDPRGPRSTTSSERFLQYDSDEQQALREGIVHGVVFDSGSEDEEDTNAGFAVDDYELDAFAARRKTSRGATDNRKNLHKNLKHRPTSGHSTSPSQASSSPSPRARSTMNGGLKRAASSSSTKSTGKLSSLEPSGSHRRTSRTPPPPAMFMGIQNIIQPQQQSKKNEIKIPPRKPDARSSLGEKDTASIVDAGIVQRRKLAFQDAESTSSLARRLCGKPSLEKGPTLDELRYKRDSRSALRSKKSSGHSSRSLGPRPSDNFDDYPDDFEIPADHDDDLAYLNLMSKERQVRKLSHDLQMDAMERASATSCEEIATKSRLWHARHRGSVSSHGSYSGVNSNESDQEDDSSDAIPPFPRNSYRKHDYDQYDSEDSGLSSDPDSHDDHFAVKKAEKEAYGFPRDGVDSEEEDSGSYNSAEDFDMDTDESYLPRGKKNVASKSSSKDHLGFPTDSSDSEQEEDSTSIHSDEDSNQDSDNSDQIMVDLDVVHADALSFPRQDGESSSDEDNDLDHDSVEGEQHSRSDDDSIIDDGIDEEEDYEFQPFGEQEMEKPVKKPASSKRKTHKSPSPPSHEEKPITVAAAAAAAAASRMSRVSESQRIASSQQNGKPFKHSHFEPMEDPGTMNQPSKSRRQLSAKSYSSTNSGNGRGKAEERVLPRNVAPFKEKRDTNIVSDDDEVFEIEVGMGDVIVPDEMVPLGRQSHPYYGDPEDHEKSIRKQIAFGGSAPSSKQKKVPRENNEQAETPSLHSTVEKKMRPEEMLSAMSSMKTRMALHKERNVKQPSFRRPLQPKIPAELASLPSIDTLSVKEEADELLSAVSSMKARVALHKEQLAEAIAAKSSKKTSRMGKIQKEESYKTQGSGQEDDEEFFNHHSSKRQANRDPSHQTSEDSESTMDYHYKQTQHHKEAGKDLDFVVPTAEEERGRQRHREKYYEESSSVSTDISNSALQASKKELQRFRKEALNEKKLLENRCVHLEQRLDAQQSEHVAMQERLFEELNALRQLLAVQAKPGREVDIDGETYEYYTDDGDDDDEDDEDDDDDDDDDNKEEEEEIAAKPSRATMRETPRDKQTTSTRSLESSDLDALSAESEQGSHPVKPKLGSKVAQQADTAETGSVYSGDEVLGEGDLIYELKCKLSAPETARKIKIMRDRAVKEDELAKASQNKATPPVSQEEKPHIPHGSVVTAAVKKLQPPSVSEARRAGKKQPVTGKAPPQSKAAPSRAPAKPLVPYGRHNESSEEEDSSSDEEENNEVAGDAEEQNDANSEIEDDESDLIDESQDEDSALSSGEEEVSGSEYEVVHDEEEEVDEEDSESNASESEVDEVESPKITKRLSRSPVGRSSVSPSKANKAQIKTHGERPKDEGLTSENVAEESDASSESEEDEDNKSSLSASESESEDERQEEATELQAKQENIATDAPIPHAKADTQGESDSESESSSESDSESELDPKDSPPKSTSVNHESSGKPVSQLPSKMVSQSTKDKSDSNEESSEAESDISNASEDKGAKPGLRLPSQLPSKLPSALPTKSKVEEDENDAHSSSDSDSSEEDSDDDSSDAKKPQKRLPSKLGAALLSQQKKMNTGDHSDIEESGSSAEDSSESEDDTAPQRRLPSQFAAAAAAAAAASKGKQSAAGAQKSKLPSKLNSAISAKAGQANASSGRNPPGVKFGVALPGMSSKSLPTKLGPKDDTSSVTSDSDHGKSASKKSSGKSSRKTHRRYSDDSDSSHSSDDSSQSSSSSGHHRPSRHRRSSSSSHSSSSSSSGYSDSGDEDVHKHKSKAAGGDDKKSKSSSRRRHDSSSSELSGDESSNSGKDAKKGRNHSGHGGRHGHSDDDNSDDDRRRKGHRNGSSSDDDSDDENAKRKHTKRARGPSIAQYGKSSLWKEFKKRGKSEDISIRSPEWKVDEDGVESWDETCLYRSPDRYVEVIDVDMKPPPENNGLDEWMTPDYDSIWLAAKRGDLRMVKKFIMKNQPFDKIDDRGVDKDMDETWLGKLMLSASKATSGHTPLYWASAMNQAKVVEFLLRKGVKKEGKESYDITTSFEIQEALAKAGFKGTKSVEMDEMTEEEQEKYKKVQERRKEMSRTHDSKPEPKKAGATPRAGTTAKPPTGAAAKGRPTANRTMSAGSNSSANSSGRGRKAGFLDKFRRKNSSTQQVSHVGGGYGSSKPGLVTKMKDAAKNVASKMKRNK